MDVVDDLKTRTDRIAQAKDLIRRRTYWAAGLGLIPLPVIDIVAISGVQVKMLLDMAALYPALATKENVQSAIGALLGGVTPVVVGGGIISAFKFVPGLGQLTGVLAVPALAAASTIALGRVFLEHFESGGTLLDFDPEKMRAFYMSELAAAKADPTGAAKAPLKAESAAGA